MIVRETETGEKIDIDLDRGLLAETTEIKSEEKETKTKIRKRKRKKTRTKIGRAGETEINERTTGTTNDHFVFIKGYFPLVEVPVHYRY